MWIFKCFFVANIIVFSIAHPMDNDLLDENDESIKNSSPPMEFPQNDSKFPVVDTNTTLLHELSGTDDSVATEEPINDRIEVEPQDNASKLIIQSQEDFKSEQVDIEPAELNLQKVDESKIDTEVPDLLTIDKNLIEPPEEPEHNDIIGVNNNIDSDSNEPQEPINFVIATSTEEFPKAEVEWIQNGHDNEDVRLLADDDILAPSSAQVREPYSEHGRGVPLVQGRYAAILAGVFIVLAVVGYTVMLSWRRYLENRYGSRQMLVNEEDIYSASDLKHFSL